MFSTRPTRSIAVVAAVIVVEGGAYGIVSATSNSVSGTGTAADNAQAAAVAAYPGGTVDCVVLQRNGDCELHMIGVNWLHHVFVNSNFTVIGAE